MPVRSTFGDSPETPVGVITVKRNTMKSISLPPSLNPKAASAVDGTRPITIIGANGAGKSRFMDEMTVCCGDRTYILDALKAFYPEREESMRPGSIDALYRESVRQQPYMRTDAVSELDKLVYMIFADELESLLDMKEESCGANRKVTLKPTRLDTIKRVWEKIFPGNRICRQKGHLMFATMAGGDLIPVQRLSQGEKVAFYYLGAASYAPNDAVVFIDTPSIFVHPSILPNLWNAVEEMRPDCTFVYNSVDAEFVNSRSQSLCIWVKNYNSEHKAWDYEVLDTSGLRNEIIMQLAGSRRPILFIEGEARRSIDARLYSLVFPDFTVKPLGSCNKVIETTRSFNDQPGLHHLQSQGIVDRDRRSDKEVGYLRNKSIMVPDVAEVENIFLLPDVVKVMAERRGRDYGKIMRRLERDVVRMFRRHAEEQALQHVRHKVKRDVECKIDARFSCITALEMHLRQLEHKLQPRRHYNLLREQFAAMIRDNDYLGILKVFNHKPMLPDSGVHLLLGYRTKEDYVDGVINALKGHGKDAEHLRTSIKHCLHADENGTADRSDTPATQGTPIRRQETQSRMRKEINNNI